MKSNPFEHRIIAGLAALCAAASLSRAEGPIFMDKTLWTAPVPQAPPLEIAPDAGHWRAQQAALRETLNRLLGALPPRPTNPAVRVEIREDRGAYWAERFTMDNGAGEKVPGWLLLPKGARGPAPAVLYCHWHGGEYDIGKTELFEKRHTPVPPGPTLAGLGYAVMAVDAPGFGERNGVNPDGERGSAGEASRAKYELWLGRTYWGMLLRDDRMALDYLCARPEIDAGRIGVAGISMGATRTWWLMALDQRIKAGVAVACLTRAHELIASQGLRRHGIYYFIPGLLQHFDNEAVIACAAPRALLCLTGDQDAGSPVSGVRAIERAARPAWDVLNSGADFQSLIYPGVGHEWTADMWERAVAWLNAHLKAGAGK